MDEDSFVELSMSAVQWHHAMTHLHRRIHHVGHFSDVHDSSSMEFDFAGSGSSEVCKDDVRCEPACCAVCPSDSLEFCLCLTWLNVSCNVVPSKCAQAASDCP